MESQTTEVLKGSKASSAADGLLLWVSYKRKRELPDADSPSLAMQSSHRRISFWIFDGGRYPQQMFQ